ncbi:hydrogenase maturation nickel metallochaperone HypA [Fervidicoccus fontis]|uniref:Hydrogenase nickel incorporation protein n=2 Tax=Fervidicoccus fontis TaxID=683846 RepID=H9ZZV6_FERFK|nr:hydrogenase/urease maturation nickel metallochaperone HypA [Fervidicoccus fontis]AFH42263.1 hydrogenase nickel incorporation protein [Fervidicoccus fontis Kam940]MBE9391014.1 hydrogenase maturation nickel metallochaperone HypA [Fervidicoccus fontis]PMB76399.1 MAG: hydrogenase/urease nickel incorporation protein HypA [Fervidicoccus fontis]HEW64342.1 hypothetical protein [Fervidicoccus fontis]
MNMHEIAIAQGIIEAIKEKAFHEKISEVKVLFGELQNIDINIVMNYVTMTLESLNIKVKLSYEIREARFKCNKCGYEWSLSDVSLSEDEREMIHFMPEAVHTVVSCPNCKSSDFEVLDGKNVMMLVR